MALDDRSRSLVTRTSKCGHVVQQISAPVDQGF